MRRGESHGVTAHIQDHRCAIAIGAGKLHSSRLPSVLAPDSRICAQADGRSGSHLVYPR